MRYITCLFLFLQTSGLLLSCNTTTLPKADCTRYRTGKFFYRSVLDDNMSTYHIVRTDSTQLESEVGTNDTTVLRLKWISDCTYELHFLKSTEVLPDTFAQIRKNFVIQTTIESGDEHYYISHTKNNLNSDIRKDTIWFDREIKPLRVRH